MHLSPAYNLRQAATDSSNVERLSEPLSRIPVVIDLESIIAIGKMPQTKEEI